jgi:hypothetical protein
MIMFIETPSTNDVLCGKDKTYENHPGNQLYRDLIVATALEYSVATSKQHKMKMTGRIVDDLISGYGSRFLKRSSVDDGAWVELTMSAARDKTSHALRFCAAQMSAPSSPPERRKSKAKEKFANDDSFRNTKIVPRKQHRRKISWDETKSATQLVGPVVAVSSSLHWNHQPPQAVYDDRIMNVASTWFIPDKVSTEHTVRDLSHSVRDDHHPCIIPFTATSNEELDLSWCYQLQDDDDFVFVE